MVAMLRKLKNGLRVLFRKEQLEQELDDEVRFHVERQIEEHVRAGMSLQEARRRARIELGGVEQVKENVREVRWGTILETFWQDIRYGARMLRRNPGFTTVAVLTLALGIGANTAIFSVVNGVLLRPLPFQNPARLVVVWESSEGATNSVSVPNYFDWRDQNQVFSDVALFRGRNYILTGAGEANRLRAGVASGRFFDLLGVQPLFGRTFGPEDDRTGADRVVVLSYGLWQRRFGADRDVLGEALLLNGNAYTVIGVMPRDFRHPDTDLVQMWLPVSFDTEYVSDLNTRGDHSFQVIARLREGVGLDQARAEMIAIASRLEAEYPGANAGMSAMVLPLLDALVEDVRPALLVLLGAVGLVLLIVCANVANLFLARAAAREREFGVRVALGAGRTRLVRHLLTESLLIAGIGGGLGLLMAIWGVDLLAALAPRNVPRLDKVAVDGPVLGITFALSVLTGLLVGLAPVRQVFRSEMQSFLREGGRGTTAVGGGRLRNILVISEVTLSLVLLVGAGLLIKSFLHLMAVNPGFDPQNVLTLRVSLPGSTYAEKRQQAAFQRQLVERIQSVPGVVSAGAVTPLPLSGGRMGVSLTVEGAPPPAPGEEAVARFRLASSDYFRVMRIPLIQGRLFSVSDTAESTAVAIISETMAARYWPRENPIGKRWTFGGGGPESKWRTIVGVVGDVKWRSLERASDPELYLPFAQLPMNWVFFVVRTNSNPMSLVPAVRSQVQTLDADLPVFAIATMDERLSRSVAQRRFTMFLLASFAGLAVVLAAVGVYGVISYSVSRRAHEIGIRMALGAQPNSILRMVLGQGLGLALAGVTLGIGGALTLTRYLESLLFGVASTDILTFSAVPALLLIVAFLASYIPARRATKVDPMVALRYE